LKTTCTDFTKGGHLVQITILGHQLLCLQSILFSIFFFLLSFFFVFLNYLTDTATQTLAAALFALMSFMMLPFCSRRTLPCPHGLSTPSQALSQHSRLAEGRWLKTFLKPA